MTSKEEIRRFEELNGFSVLTDFSKLNQES